MDLLKKTHARNIGLFLCIFLLLGAVPANGEDSRPTRADRMMAASIYKFSRYIHWLDENKIRESSVTTSVCILGADPYAGALHELQQSTNIRVRLVGGSGQTAGCDMLVISTSERANLDKVLMDIHDKSMVTISKIDRFTDRGGMIRLYAKNNRIRFDLNQVAARKVQLRFDLRLTRLAASLVD